MFCRIGMAGAEQDGENSHGNGHKHGNIAKTGFQDTGINTQRPQCAE